MQNALGRNHTFLRSINFAGRREEVRGFPWPNATVGIYEMVLLGGTATDVVKVDGPSFNIKFKIQNIFHKIKLKNICIYI